MENPKIERLAVRAITRIADSVDSMLKPEIPEGDKSISFDGEIQVFDSVKETVDSLIGKVPVQVKGKTVKNFSNQTRTFPIKKNHLKNYYNNQGVLYFVVELLKNGDSKVYYKQLLPLEIHAVLNDKSKKSKTSERAIEFRALEETELYQVCYKFLKEQNRQPLALVEYSKNLESKFTSVKATSLTLTNKNMNEIFQHDFTLYGEIDGLEYPLHPNMRLETYGVGMYEKIYIDSTEYNLFGEFTKDKNGMINRVYEKSLRLSYKEEGDKFTADIEAFQSIDTMLKVIPFFIKILEGHEVLFMNQKLRVDIEKNPANEFIENLKNQQSLLDKSLIMFEDLGLSSKIKISGHFNQILDDLGFLNKILLEKDYSSIRGGFPKESICFVNTTLGELNIGLFYNSFSDIKLVNAFSDNINKLNRALVFKEEDGQSFPHSIYILMSESILRNSRNLDIQEIKKSFDMIDPFAGEYIEELTNRFCLNCIRAYDGSKKIPLLELAKHIYMKNNKESVVQLINLLQINHRINGSLDEREIQKLLEIKSSSNQKNDILFAVNTLLDNRIEAKYYFSKLSEPNQKLLSEFPIYNLFNSPLSSNNHI